VVRACTCGDTEICAEISIGGLRGPKISDCCCSAAAAAAFCLCHCRRLRSRLRRGRCDAGLHVRSHGCVHGARAWGSDGRGVEGGVSD
jgi:hypothetical protein